VAFLHHLGVSIYENTDNNNKKKKGQESQRVSTQRDPHRVNNRILLGYNPCSNILFAQIASTIEHAAVVLIGENIEIWTFISQRQTLKIHLFYDTIEKISISFILPMYYVMGLPQEAIHSVVERARQNTYAAQGMHAMGAKNTRAAHHSSGH
jgi:hypothetical protein